MPIPKSIHEEHILSAIEYIDKHGIAENRESTKYAIFYKDKHYPPKYVISIASRFANGYELNPDEFSGGAESNNFLGKLGFRVVEELNDTFAAGNTPYPFVVGHYYTRKDIYSIVNVPEPQQGGNWDTGYTRFRDDSYVFVNVGTAGRTGHDHPNRFVGNDLDWYGKNRSKLSHDSIQSLIHPKGNVFIFAREDSDDPKFIYIGVGKAKEYFDTTPVNIIWSFNDPQENHPEIPPGEESDPQKYVEGSLKQVYVNVYERNPIARKKCIEHFGSACSVCQFNFHERYGEIGKDFIHVHHLKPLHEVGEKYEVHPIEDLRPVCPNCHSMLHKRKPAYSIEELRMIIQNQAYQE